jgi:hypothetical protein
LPLRYKVVPGIGDELKNLLKLAHGEALLPDPVESLPAGLMNLTGPTESWTIDGA